MVKLRTNWIVALCQMCAGFNLSKSNPMSVCNISSVSVVMWLRPGQAKSNGPDVKGFFKGANTKCTYIKRLLLKTSLPETVAEMRFDMMEISALVHSKPSRRLWHQWAVREYWFQRPSYWEIKPSCDTNIVNLIASHAFYFSPHNLQNVW